MESNRKSGGILSLGVAARETAQALKTLAQAARGVAASTSDPAATHAMLDSARDVMEGSAMLIQEAKQALIAPGDAESQQRLAQVRPRNWQLRSLLRWSLFSGCEHCSTMGVFKTFPSNIAMLALCDTHFLTLAW